MKRILFLTSAFLITNCLVTNYSLSFAQVGFGGKAVLGEVTKVVDKTLEIKTKDQTQVELTTTEVTKFVRAGRRLKLNDVKIGDQVVAVGALSTLDNTFLVKTLVVKPIVLRELSKMGVYGTVLEVGDNSFTLTNQKLAAPLEINVTSQTVFRKTGKKIAFSKIEPGQKLVAVVIKEANGDLTGRLVLVIKEAPAVELQATPEAIPTE